MHVEHIDPNGSDAPENLCLACPTCNLSKARVTSAPDSVPGAYVDKLLQGVPVGDLLVEQLTKFELVVNLKTAKALGLTMPPAILIRADEVLE